ncbi:MAG: hypothetical protein J5958_01270 [Clostridia bacterium]|nr:hypothetical protein [Clostridia bacterium]
MSKKSALNVKNLILCAIIIVGLVLTIIGFFGNFTKGDGVLKDVDKTLSGLAKSNKDLIKDLGDDYKLEGFAAISIFAWVTFFLAIATAVLFVIVKFLGLKNQSSVLALVGCATVVAAVLLFVFSLIMVGKWADRAELIAVLGNNARVSAGPILMLVGGLLAGGAAAASAKV